MVTTRNGTTVQSLTYSRNAKGMITAVSSSDYGFAEAWTYTYDALDRLITATSLHNSALTQSFTYSLDGNMLTGRGRTFVQSFISRH